MSLCTTISFAAGSRRNVREGFEMRRLDNRPLTRDRSVNSSRAAFEAALTPARDVREMVAGSPEHTALVEALRREFPEIYGLSSKCASVRRA